MIAIGNTDSKVHGMFIGNTRIKSAYLGDQQVFPRNVKPLEIEPDWEDDYGPEEEEFMSDDHDEPTISDQIDWVSMIQKSEPDQIPAYTITENQWQILNSLVQEMVAEDPTLDEVSPELQEISQELQLSQG